MSQEFFGNSAREWVAVAVREERKRARKELQAMTADRDKWNRRALAAEAALRGTSRQAYGLLGVRFVLSSQPAPDQGGET